ncbi:DeoR family transcriptional regulator [Edwardsiella ictaluri]|uniref:DeoR family transcriptional regulator n=1 Tax=Edwardsiella ictaluri TaxID=67780 RepID=UPI0039F67506
MSEVKVTSEHDKLATRLAIIVSRLFQGEKLNIHHLAREFNVSERTLRRDLHTRLIYLDIHQAEGNYALASHYFRRRTVQDMKELATLLHLDKILPVIDAKLLSLLLEDKIPSPYKIFIPSTQYKPTLFGDFSQLTLAIIYCTPVQIRLEGKISYCVHPYRLLCFQNEWFLAGKQASGVFVSSLSKIQAININQKERFQIDKQLLELIERVDFIQALPYMDIIDHLIDYNIKTHK